MGISGLLPFLKKSSVNTHIRQFKGCTVAVDAYCWLHKGAFSCADKLVKGEKTTAYVTYCMKYVNMLLSHGVTPILVFDGRHLPSKLVTETKRRENRERYKIQAREYLRQGNTSKARECFQKCVDVTSAMALELMKACRAKHIDCIVAPYEADSQLAYFSLQGIAHLVITEDSDLLTFGCTRVFFKMDHGGSGVLIENDKLNLSLGSRAEYFNHEKFRRMCILSGCDYLPSIPGIGLGKAFKFFSQTTNDDINTTLCRIPSCLKMPSLEVTKEYRDGFLQAEQTFLYQLVYDPVNRKVVPLNPYPEDIDVTSLSFAGAYLDENVAFHLALGNLDVANLQRIADYNPDGLSSKKPGFAFTKHVSIWSRTYSVQNQKPDLESVPIEAAKPTLCRKITTKIDFSLTTKAQTVQMTASELTSQYITKETGPVSPVLSRKRKRSIDSPGQSSQKVTIFSELNQNVSESILVDEIPAVLDPFIENVDQISPRQSQTTSGALEKKTPLKNSNPFVKLKSPPAGNSAAATPPSCASQFSALKTFSQLKTRNSQGEEIITSAYFQSEPSASPQNTTLTDRLAQTMLNSDKHLIPITNTKASFQPFKPVVSSSTGPKSFFLNQLSPDFKKPSSGCRVAGLSRPTQKQSISNSKIAATSGMRQLNLRDMFAVKH